MQRFILKKFNKKILCILILFVMIYSMFGFIPQHTYAASTYTYTSNSNDLPLDFDSKYPGYRILINTLVKEHPNWTFKLVETNLDWNTVLNNESTHGKNLVQPGYYTSEWGCSCNKVYDDPWKCASKSAVEYMMDPRNFLNSYDVFQFQELTVSYGDKNAIASMISGTFMDKNGHRDECINAIIEGAKKYNVNPYFIISKIIQEQSVNGSSLSLGEGYDVNGDGIKEYVGYYNLFNIGAYPSNNKGTIENGLIRAKNNGWDSMYKSILAGAEFIKKSYMDAGQTTIYFQKYNVIDKNNLYRNQYMTNVWGAYSEGKIMRSKYIRCGVLEDKFTFTIPLYKGMPTKSGDYVYVNVNENSSLSLKAEGKYTGKFLLSINPKTVVLRIEKASSKDKDGYYWDKVITPYGIGYMARNASDDSKQYLIPLTLVAPNDTNIDTSKNNGFANPDSNNNIFAEPNTTVNKIKAKYTNAVIVNKDGKEITGDSLVGTGAKIKIDGVVKYTIVKLGDATGDGKVDAVDLLRIRKHLINADKLVNEYLSAMDIYKDGKVDAIDLLKLRKYLTNAENITL